MEYEKLIEKHKIGYEVTCLRYQEEKPYKEIARQFNLSSYNARDKQKNLCMIYWIFIYAVLESGILRLI